MTEGPLARGVAVAAERFLVIGARDREGMRAVGAGAEWVGVRLADRAQRVVSGKSGMAGRDEILLPDRQSAALASAARANNPNALSELPLEYIDETLQFHPEWVVDKSSPRPLLLIAGSDDRLVPPEDCQSLFDKAGEPKKMVTLPGVGHYEVYVPPAFDDVMKETVAWFEGFLPAR